LRQLKWISIGSPATAAGTVHAFYSFHPLPFPVDCSRVVLSFLRREPGCDQLALRARQRLVLDSLALVVKAN